MNEIDLRKCPRGKDPATCEIATCCLACDYYYESPKKPETSLGSVLDEVVLPCSVDKVIEHIGRKENMSKILILSASPQRDSEIDKLLSEKLTAMGNEVWVKPCLREGRVSVLEIKPDVVIMPPIRNVYSRDFVNQCKDFGCAVVTRHTEPSVAWEDFKLMRGFERASMLGQFAYNVDAEIVWSQDEAEILKGRGCPFPIVPVGAFVADVYKQDDFNSKFMNREAFCEKHNLDKDKKTILLSSAWGFIDSSPDLQINGQAEASADEKGRGIWIDMAKRVHEKFKNRWNILVTLHPSVGIGLYKKELEPLGIEIDTESTAVELLKNCDMLVHAGSTMGIEMHFLNKPAYQFGDVNNLVGANWWQRSNAAISRVSPHYDTVEKLLGGLADGLEVSNANPDTVKELEEGRYGNMDGKATERTAEIINKLEGSFKYCWPHSPFDYTQSFLRKSPVEAVKVAKCGICGKEYALVNQNLVNKILSDYKIETKLPPIKDMLCPHCGARFMGGGCRW